MVWDGEDNCSQFEAKLLKLLSVTAHKRNEIVYYFNIFIWLDKHIIVTVTCNYILL